MSIRSFAMALIAGVLGALMAAQAPAQDRDRALRYVSQFPLIGDDGGVVPNHTVTLPAPIEKMPGVVTAANPDGKTTLIEFYDLNCPFCRIASVDIEDMVSTDGDLKLVLVPYPVLGPASVAASQSSWRWRSSPRRSSFTPITTRSTHSAARLPVCARSSWRGNPASTAARSTAFRTATTSPRRSRLIWRSANRSAFPQRRASSSAASPCSDIRAGMRCKR